MEKVQLSLFHQTVGFWDLLRRGLWTSLPTLTCGGNTEITSYVKYGWDASGLQISFYCRIFNTHSLHSDGWIMLKCVCFFSPLVGGGPGGYAHSDADDGEGLPTLLPNDRPTSRWPEPGTGHTVSFLSPLPVKYAAFWCLTFSVCIIRFGTYVSGDDTVSRPLRINNPSPFGKHNHEN